MSMTEITGNHDPDATANVRLPPDEVEHHDKELESILGEWQEAHDRHNGHLSCLSFDTAVVPPDVPQQKPSRPDSHHKAWRV